MKVVVGLGNPGKKYAGTRHNVGFQVLEILSRRHSAPAWRKGFEAEVTEISFGGNRVLLVAPQTYMNLSGRSVKGVVHFYKCSLNDLIVISDDLNLPAGQLRLRQSGSAGGQKGLQNIIEQLGTNEFARLRIGIGRPPEGMDSANYVLQKFTSREQAEMERAVDRAADAVEMWTSAGMDVTMNRFNRSPDAGASASEDP